MGQTTSLPNGKYIPANGLNIYYEEFGSGEPLILIHGGMGIGKNAEPHIRAFSEKFRVIIPDSRGHGKTDNPSGEFSYRLMADDMAAFIQALKLDHPSICGWSDGGQIALELGMRYSELLRGIVVGAAWYRFSPQYQTMLKTMGFEAAGRVNFEQMKQVLSEFAEQLPSWHSPIHGPEHWKTLATQISSMWWTPLGYTTDDFQTIKNPTLLVIGDRDQIVPVEEAVEMYRLIPKSELVVVANADHSLPGSRPELFTTLVLDFLLRHTSRE